MALGKGSKVLIGILGVLIVLGGAAGIYIAVWSSKHKVDYGKKHKITKDEASQIDRFQARLGECKKVVFEHPKFPYLPPKGAPAEILDKAVVVMVKEVKTCLQGVTAADGKGGEPQMKGKDFEPVLGTKTCEEFAAAIITLKACAGLTDALAGEEKDGGLSFVDNPKAGSGGSADDMAAGDMAAGDMAAPADMAAPEAMN